MGAWRGPHLFTVGSLRAVELDRDGLPALQRFFEANRDYFLDVEGHGPASDEALRALEDDPPAGMPFGRKWLLSLFIVGSARSAWSTGTNTLSVMYKPLDGGSLPEYFALVPRDRPETP